MKIINTIASAALAATLVASTAMSAVAQDEINIAGVLQNTSDPFWQSIACGAQAKAAELGVKLDMFTSTNTDAAPITASFNAALLTDPDGVFVNPFNANQFVTQYGELMAAGKPVVTASGTEPAAQYKIVFSSGDTEPYIEEALKLLTVESGKMVVMGGIPGIVPLENRYKPFVEAVKAAKPGLTEIEPIYSTFDVNKAQAAVSAALIANPDLALIVASNGPDGVGAAAAVKAAGLEGKVTLIAFDAVPPEVAALKEGVITALIAQAAGGIGAAQVETLVEYIKGGHTGAVPVSTDFVGIPQKLLTKDTVDAPENAGYVYKSEC
jgi:ribose transport system substrate-binding protein